MANITKYIICASAGAAWAAFVGKWAESVVDETNQISYDLEDKLGCKTFLIRVGDGTDFTYWRYVIADLPSTAVAVPINYLLQSPGWRTQPPILDAAYGAVDTKDSFENQVYLAKNSFITSLTGATLQVATIADNTYTALAGVHLWHFYLKYKVGLLVAVDVLTLTTRDPATTVVEWSNNGQTTDGIQAGGQTVGVAAGGGGGGVDLAPLVQVIQDAAAKTTVVGLNREGPLYAVESSEVLELP